MKILARSLAALTACCALASPAAAEPASADDILLPPETLGEIVGVELGDVMADLEAPSTELIGTTPPDCQVDYSTYTTLVFGDDWTDFHGSVFGDKPLRPDGPPQHILAETAARYLDAEQAAEVFTGLEARVRACGHQQLIGHHAAGDRAWNFVPNEIAKARIRWHTRPADEPLWRCSTNWRLEDSVVLVARFCETASDVQARAQDAELGHILDQMAERIG